MLCFFFTDTPTTEIYTLSLHDALPISATGGIDLTSSNHGAAFKVITTGAGAITLVTGHASHTIKAAKLEGAARSEEHTSELQSQSNLVCRLLLEKKKAKTGCADARSTA